MARTGRIGRRRHPHVMPAIVFDEEVAVSDRRQRDPGEPSLEAIGLVAEFVRRVDRHADCRVERECKGQIVVPRHRMRAHDP